MPALAPPIGDTTAAKLHAIGKRIRAHRERLGVSATAAAEASGMSRVTLHRVERGEPSVAMAAYMNAITALGLEFEVVNPQDHRSGKLNEGERPLLPSTLLPSSIRLADYPQLKRLAWQLHGAAKVTPKEALGLYERNWRHVDVSAMSPREQTLVNTLARELAGGRLLV
jgi:transcriptional regulator with XRE-family HTH domain